MSKIDIKQYSHTGSNYMYKVKLKLKWPGRLEKTQI